MVVLQRWQGLGWQTTSISLRPWECLRELKYCLQLVEAIGHQRTNDRATRLQQRGQTQVGLPQVPLKCHGDTLETYNFANTSLMRLSGLRTVALRHLLNSMLSCLLYVDLNYSQEVVCNQWCDEQLVETKPNFRIWRTWPKMGNFRVFEAQNGIFRASNPIF